MRAAPAARVEDRRAAIAHALAARGVERGERIATLAWNDHRHLEAYYGVSCMGAVLHTVNPRLFPDQIAFILADAQDTHLFVDPTLLPVVEGLADRLPPSLRAVVVMGEEARMPAASKLSGRVEVLDILETVRRTVPQLRADGAGVVTAVSAEPGQVLSAGTPVTASSQPWDHAKKAALAASSTTTRMRITGKTPVSG